MKAEELRLGNLVLINYATGDWMEHAVDKDSFLVSLAGTLVCESFRPIPLTEEWLLKFGFDNDFNFMIDIPNRKYLFGLNSSFEVFLLSNSRESEIDLGKIQYVHQLQNLYFALTGEELIIK